MSSNSSRIVFAMRADLITKSVEMSAAPRTDLSKAVLTFVFAAAMLVLPPSATATLPVLDHAAFASRLPDLAPVIRSAERATRRAPSLVSAAVRDDLLRDDAAILRRLPDPLPVLQAAEAARVPVGQRLLEAAREDLARDPVRIAERLPALDALFADADDARYAALLSLYGRSDSEALRALLARLDNDAQSAGLAALSESEAARLGEPEPALAFGPQAVPLSIVEAIVRASATFSVDASYMMAVADRESAFDPDAEASTSSATGLYQFIEQTWLSMIHAFGADHGLDEEAAQIVRVGDRFVVADEAMLAHILDLRRDPRLAALMAAALARSDEVRLSLRIGRPLRTSELYIAHFLGTDGAARLIRAAERTPRASAARMFPAAARANRSVFYEGRGRQARALSVAEVHRRLTTSIDRRMARFANPEDKVVVAGGTAAAIVVALVAR